MLLAAGATGALAQTSTSSTSAADTPLFQWGGDFRLRYEAYDAVHTLSDSAAFHHRDYFRTRLRLWETTTPFPDLTLFGRISAEPRYWFQAASKAAEGKEWKYGLFDNLYAKWSTEAAGTPIVVVAGRQDIQLGDQWLVSDGTPLDGSWTNHFDAARFTIDAKSIKTKFEVIAFNQQAYPGDRLPILGSDEKAAALQEQDETGVVLYASNKSIKNIQLDGYFMYKGDDAVTSKGYNGDLYTLGGRIAGTPEAHWLYSVEAAYQFGRRNDSSLSASNPFTAAKNLVNYGEISRDVSAFGGIAKVVYSFKDTLNNQLTFSTEYLSGDKSGTGKDEMFDNLWGRIPRISECWAVALGQDTGRNSQYGNLFRLGATWSIAPTKNTTVSATYGALFAVEDNPTRAVTSTGAPNANFSRDGNFRGHIFQVVLKQKFTKQLSGLLLAEYCPMGNYYTHEDAMTFLRAEMLVTF
jgi:hypothetical protein